MTLFEITPFEVPDPVVYAIPVFVVFVILEAGLIIHALKEDYNMGEALASVYTGLGIVLVSLFTKLVYINLYFLGNEIGLIGGLAPIDLSEFFSWGWHFEHWWVWLLLLFLDDLTFYWFHRLSHRIRLLWGGHVTHHSSQEYNLATALRQGWWEHLLKYIFWFPLALLGFHPFMIFIMMEFNLIYQFFMHTRFVRGFGFLGNVLNTPSHHRVHHGSQLKYLDKNYAGIFIIWDKFFGSFQKEEEEAVYGLTKNIDSKNPFFLVSHELLDMLSDVRRAQSFKDKIRYLLNAPGWSHDGEDLRTNTLRKKTKR